MNILFVIVVCLEKFFTDHIIEVFTAVSVLSTVGKQQTTFVVV